MTTSARGVTPINGCRTTRIYCLPGCPPGRRTRPENRVYFGSREEAVSAGYRACKVCRPDGPNPQPETLTLARHHSPLGDYLILASEGGVVCAKPEDRIGPRLARWTRAGTLLQPGRNQHTDALSREMDAYFDGVLRRFHAALDLRGTPFQRRVWTALGLLPYGETTTYGELARSIGRPEAPRAVGHAVGQNPVSIAVPCHRVIGADGSLTGYASGLHRKEALLKLEGVLA